MSRKLPEQIPTVSMNGQSEVFVVKYNVDGNYCLSGHSDRSIKLWNANTGAEIKSYTGAHNREIFDIAIFKDNNKFASCGGDKTFYIWDVLTGQILRKVIAHNQRINTIALNPLENIIATGSYDNQVKIWDLQTKFNKPIQVLDDFKDSITKIIITDDSIIAGSVDGILRTYDIRMGKLIRDQIESPINGLDIAEDKKFLLVSCLNSTVKLVDLAMGEIVSEYKGHHKSGNYHSCVKFSKDNSYILQASEDCRVVLYDIVAKEEILSLKGHSRPVVSIDTHPTKEGHLISGSADGLIKERSRFVFSLSNVILSVIFLSSFPISNSFSVISVNGSPNNSLNLFFTITSMLYSWKVDQIVTQIESDFANGYLFGEILVLHDLSNDISSFTKKTNKESKIKNFQQVESVLRNLKIKFDAKLINQIMNEERGAALRLLYQIKLAISKMNETQKVDALGTQTLSGLKQKTLENRLQEVQALKQTLSMTSGLQTMNKSKKLGLVEKHLLKFENTKNMQSQKAWNDQQDEETLIKRLHQDTRQDSLKKMEENQQYMEEWEAEGKKNWKQNLNKRQDTIDKAKYYEDKEVKQFQNKLMRELDDATKDMMGGIDEFENNLQKLGIEKNTNMEDAIKKMEEKKGVPPGQIQNFSYAASMNKIKEKKNMSDFAAKERDRRRRKLIVDQANTQQSLDTKKNEVQLIEKFKKKQHEEQQMAYLNWRNQECKELVLNNRVAKAQSVDVKRQEQTDELERKRNEEYEKVIEQHRKETLDKKKYYKQVRREEKLKKRQFNIEICSEVLDQILDVAEEAFQQTMKKDAKKLAKPDWREVMDKFVQKKKIHNVIDIHSSPLKQFAEEDEHSELTVIDKNQDLTEIIDQMQGSHEYQDMLQYLSVSGEFNLSYGGIDQWLEMQNLCQGMDFQFLDNMLPPSNPDLGTKFQELLMNLWKEDKTDISERITKESQGLPHYLTLKLAILGKSFGGKKTVGKQIQDMFPGKIKLFKMDDIIREAIEYANPKPQTEAPPTKDAKKAPAKGKAEEAPVDQYAGMDSSIFKEIGRTLKQMIGESDYSQQGLDLVAMIKDDKVLIRLFMAKLKLMYPQDQPENVKIEEIKQNIIKERELIQQLAEIEQQNQLLGEKAPAKGKAVPDKKGAKPSNEDQLRQELEQLQKVQAEGWVLLDFPRTLDQSKLMEQLVIGYICLLDQQKSHETKMNEAWQKLVAPSTTVSEDFKGEPSLQQSTLDGTIILDVQSQECQRRSQSRKIDPQTGNIYHLEDNPPPEGDNKLRDRLQDYNDPESDQQRIKGNHINFDYQEKPLEKWMSGFGLQDEGIHSVSLLKKVQVGDKIKKEEVFEQVNAHIERILEFKQGQFDKKKQAIKDQMDNDLRESSRIEEEKVSQLQQEQQEEEQEQQQELTQQSIQLEQRDSQMHSQQSKRSKAQKSQASYMRKSSVLGDQDKRDMWAEFEKTYYSDALSTFRVIRKQKEQVCEGLNSIQSNFISFLQRSDGKQSKINHFVDSFNKFSEEFPDLREDEQTKQELSNRVDQLSNDLWSIVEQRKDEGLSEHQKIQNNGWIQLEMKKLILHVTKIIHGEICKYIAIYQIIASKVPQHMGINVEDSLNVLMNQGYQLFDRLFSSINKAGGSYQQKEKLIDDHNGSPILNQLFIQILSQIQQHSNIELPSLNDKDREIVEIEQSSLLFRLNMIKTWLQLKLQEFQENSKKVFEAMDDWIVVAVQKENAQSQDIISMLIQAVQEQHMRLDYHTLIIDDLQLYADITTLEFNSQDQPQYMQQMVVPSQVNDCRFKISDLEGIYKQLRFHSYEECIDEQTFIHLMVLSYKEGTIPIQWRFKDIAFIIRLAQKYRVNYDSSPKKKGHGPDRQFVNWKIIFTIFLLLECQAQGDECRTYIESLTKDRETIQMEELIQEPAWFDQVIGIPEQQIRLQSEEDEDEEFESQIELDHDRIRRVKTLLFNTHKSNTGVLKVQDYTDVIEDLTRKAEGYSYATLIFDQS